MFFNNFFLLFLAQMTRGFVCRSANYFSNKECSLLAIERSGTNDQKYTTRERVTHFENTCHLRSRYHNLHENFTNHWTRASAKIAGPGVDGLVEILEIPLQ